MQKYYKYYKGLYIKFPLVMVLFLVTLIIAVVGLINYAARCYLRWTILWEGFDCWKNRMQKTYFVQKLAVSNFKRKDCKDRMGIIYSVR